MHHNLACHTPFNCMHGLGSPHHHLHRESRQVPGPYRNTCPYFNTHVHTEMAVMATELLALLAECPLTLRSPQSSLTQPSGLLQCQGVATEKEMHVLLT